MDVEADNVDRDLVTIASRSIATLVRFNGIGDVSRIYHTAQGDGIDFRLSYIGRTSRQRGGSLLTRTS